MISTIQKNVSLLFVLVLSLALGCKETETVLINKAPVFPGKSVPLSDLPNQVNQSVLRIGELNLVQNLDPLFVNNNGEMRIIHLVCEGLVGLNKEGDIVPGIAKKWHISNDSLMYTFTLSEKKFHASELFFNGLGRAVTAQDVRYVFERMAWADVPGRTARLFWSIEGMDIYYAEHHEIYDKERRSLKTISGILTPNDSTVQFKLDYKDSRFLRNLTRPEASIYPKESADSRIYPLSKWPIGTKDWKFSGLFRDSIITLKPVFESTKLTDSISRKRIEFYFFQNEVSLYKKFFLGEIDIVPELGPQLSKAVLGPDGQLSPTYSNQFSLISTVSNQSFNLYFNPENRQNVTQQEAILLLQGSAILEKLSQIPVFDRIVSVKNSVVPGSERNKITPTWDKKKIILSYDENPIALEILRQFYGSFTDKSLVSIVKSPVYGRETVFFVRENGYEPKSDAVLLARFYPKRSGLQKADNIRAGFSNEPWWITIN